MQKRMVAFFVAIVMGFGALACRYASLCGGAEQSRYAGAFGSREISVEIQSARGSILDRNGEFLCGGEPVLAALVDPLSLSEESAEALRRAALDQSAVEEAIRVGRPFLAYISQEVRGEGLWALTAHRRYSSLAQNLIGYVDAEGRGVCGLEAAAELGADRIAVVGGVAANSELRAALPDAVLAPLPLCTDNAAMIASAGRYVEAVPYPGYLALDAFASR